MISLGFLSLTSSIDVEYNFRLGYFYGRRSPAPEERAQTNGNCASHQGLSGSGDHATVTLRSRCQLSKMSFRSVDVS